MSNINLLPWRQARVFHKNNIFFFFAAIFACCGVIIIYFVNIYLGVLVGKQKNDIEFFNQIISVYQGKIKEINGLKERKDMALSRAEVINSLQAKRGRVIAILDGLVKCVPDGIIFNRVSVTDNVLNISGVSDSTSRVSLFMRSIEKTNIFSSAQLQEIQSSGDGNATRDVAFVLSVKITE